MGFMKDLKIQMKLMLSFGFVSVLTAGIAITSAVMLSRGSSITAEINDKWLPGVKLLDSMHSNHSTIRRYVGNVLLSDTEADRSIGKEKIRAQQELLHTGFVQFQKLTSTPDEKQLLEYLGSLVQRDNDIIEQVLHLQESGQAEQAKHLYMTDSKAAMKPPMRPVTR